MNNIVVRTLWGTLFISTVIGAIVFGILPTVLLMGVFMVVGLFEFYRLIRKENREHPIKWVGYFGGILLYLILVSQAIGFLDINLNLLFIPLLFLPFLVVVFSNLENPLRNLISTIFPWIYIVYPFGLMIYVYTEGASEIHHWVFLLGLFILVWSNDTFAYLSGRFFGKHKLFERISPKKTWEGAIGGLVFTVISAFIYAYFAESSLLFWALAAFIISPASILGDLFESRIKRIFDVKDTGTIMPGHGGILDRFDAVIYATPFFYLFLMLYV